HAVRFLELEPAAAALSVAADLAFRAADSGIGPRQRRTAPGRAPFRNAGGGRDARVRGTDDQRLRSGDLGALAHRCPGATASRAPDRGGRRWLSAIMRG